MHNSRTVVVCPDLFVTVALVGATALPGGCPAGVMVTASSKLSSKPSICAEKSSLRCCCCCGRTKGTVVVLAVGGASAVVSAVGGASVVGGTTTDNFVRRDPSGGVNGCMDCSHTYISQAAAADSDTAATAAERSVGLSLD